MLTSKTLRSETAMVLSIQLFVNGKWHDAADIQFSGLAPNSAVTLAYNFEFIKAVPAYGLRDHWACSINAEVSAVPTDYPHWPALLDDILPAGKSRQWWLNYLDLAIGFNFIEQKLQRMGVINA